MRLHGYIITSPKHSNRSVLLCLVLAVLVHANALNAAPVFRAGAAKVDISPQQLPVIRNGGFIEAQDSRIADPIHARALALDDGSNRLVMVIVDSCMMPREFCDAIKAEAARKTGLRPDRMLLAATHAHSAPSVMDYCLGSRADPEYTRYLPGKIVEAIEAALARLQPARAAWASIDAGEWTNVRRWIMRPDKMRVDPFGQRSMRANMHPGYNNPDFIGPSGPKDPWLSLLSLQTSTGDPLALLANFSMHYFGGHDGVSADYYGAFSEGIAQRLAPNVPQFVGIMSQGTSGDLWWADYDRPKVDWTMDQYTGKLLDLVEKACRNLQYRTEISLAMSERRMELMRRLPDEKRLAWAQPILQAMGDRRPRTQEEVYAEQALYIHQHPREALVLQGLRIGDLAIAAIPNEVFALTGLKIKAFSPLASTFNIELANGASGYIPPPEQHALGGYTTWPARTAGLEVQAEPKIAQTVVELLEEVTGKPRRPYTETIGDYARAVMRSSPAAYWRLGEFEGSAILDASGHQRPGIVVGNVAHHVPGPDADAFGPLYQRPAKHLAGGYLQGDVPGLGRTYSVEFWLWSGMSNNVREITGTLVSRGVDQLVLAGTAHVVPGRLLFGSLAGRSVLTPRQWHHVVLLRDGNAVRVHLDGQLQPDLEGEVPNADALAPVISLGGGANAQTTFEGKLDEAALYDRILTGPEIFQHFKASGLARPEQDQKAEASADSELAPLTPAESMRRTHVAEGFVLELVAAEPMVQDPVAIDWGADGALWVAEMADYPYGMDGKGKAGGRIRRLVDTDADGRYDQSSIFLDGVNFPTSVMTWSHGVFVAAAPEIFYAEDVDGDGRADKKEVWFSGFSQGNQQLRANSLRWGLDNWIYGAAGGHHSGFANATKIKSLLTGQEVGLGSRDFRFQPQTALLDPQSGPSQFGRVRDDWGQWFGVQNSFPLWHFVLADHYARRNADVAAPDGRRQLRLPPNPLVFPKKPAEKRFHSFEQTGRFTSACGPEIYRDELLFPHSERIHAFTCEPFHNVVQHHVLTRDGYSFRGSRAENDNELDFFASADRWCRPVMARTGPDGALWVVDMYRYMIEHPDWLPQEGRKELEPHYRLGEAFGRIYRILPAGVSPRPFPVLKGKPAMGVEFLASPNGATRDLAHRWMVQGQNASVAPAVDRMARSHPDPRARLQALCVLDGLNALSIETLSRALEDAHFGVRCQALRLSETRATHHPELIAAATRLSADSDAAVQFQLACTLGQWNDPRAGQALVRLATGDGLDAMMAAAIMSSAKNYYQDLVGAVADRPLFAEALMTMGTAQIERLPHLLAKILPPDPSRPSMDSLRLCGQWLDVLQSHKGSLETLRTSQVAALTPKLDAVDQVIGAARRLIVDSEREQAERTAALALLGRQPGRLDADLALVATMLTPRTNRDLQQAALKRIATWDHPAATATLLHGWNQYSPDLRQTLTESLMSKKPGALALLHRIQEGVIPAIDIGPAYRQRLLKHPDKDVASLAAQVFAVASDVERQSVLARYRSALALSGVAEKGRNHFEKRCALCHALDNAGRAIGPDLRSLTDRSPEGLLVAIVDPSSNVEPKYLGYTATLNTGETVYGLVLSETGNSVVMQLLDGTRRELLRQHLQSLSSSTLSFMPNGLEADLSLQDMADLIAYIRAAGR